MHGLSNFQKRKLKEGVHLEDQGLDGRTILQWVLQKYFGRVVSRSVKLTIGVRSDG
jgi:hypothetical protein